jgi:hypothetical protein
LKQGQAGDGVRLETEDGGALAYDENGAAKQLGGVGVDGAVPGGGDMRPAYGGCPDHRISMMRAWI